MNEVPSFIEPELARLYNTLHSSLPFFKVFRSTDQVSTYVAWDDCEPIVILLFRLVNGRVEVLNEMIDIAPLELSRFVRYIFARLPAANIVSFKAVKTDTEGFPFPLQKNNAKETYAIALPGTPAEYTESLGKSTRTNIRYSLNKITRDYPSFACQFYVNDQVNEEHIREIIRLSERRISGKASHYSHDVQRIIHLTRLCGFVNVLTIDGKVCAGTVNYRVGSGVFGEVIGHDFSYEKYGLGKLSVYLTICESITRGCTKFYLGGGRFDFKGRILSAMENMDRLEIYRSPLAMVFNFDNAVKASVAAGIRRVKVWLHEHQDRFIAKCVFSAFYFWRSLSK